MIHTEAWYKESLDTQPKTELPNALHRLKSLGIGVNDKEIDSDCQIYLEVTSQKSGDIEEFVKLQNSQSEWKVSKVHKGHDAWPGSGYRDNEYLIYLINPKIPVRYSGTLYHVTSKQLLPTILKKGLVPRTPKTLTFENPGVYLSKSLEGINSVLDDFKGGYEPWRGEEFVLLAVKVPPGAELFRDCEYGDKDLLYTTSAIPPHNIEIVRDL